MNTEQSIRCCNLLDTARAYITSPLCSLYALQRAKELVAQASMLLEIEIKAAEAAK